MAADGTPTKPSLQSVPPSLGGATRSNRIPSAAGRGALDIPGFQAAMERCRDALAGALGER